MGAFDGLAEIYEKSRLGYPVELRDHLIEMGALGADTAVVDLGAGTGQLARLAAEISTDVLAIDPEPDMAETGRRLTVDVPAIRWRVGADRDISTLIDPAADLVMIGNAFHHMDQASLLRNLDKLVSSDGAIVICSTSVPVWLQDAAWSHAVRDQLRIELGRQVGRGGTPDHESDKAALGASAFNRVEEWSYTRDQQRSADSIVGEIASSASGQIDSDAIGRLLDALAPHLTAGAVVEHVTTTAIIGRRAHWQHSPAVCAEPE